jgi:toxin ParE1/3/4
MRLSWSTRARADFFAVIKRIAMNSPTRATAFVHAVENRTRLLQRFPSMGRSVPELEKEFPSIKEILIEGYRLIYQLHSRHLEVITFFHGSRRFPRRHSDS